MRPGWAWRLRGMAFVVITALSLIVFVPFLMLLTPAPLAWRFRFSNLWTGFLVRWIGACMGIHHRIRGLENLPAGPRIYVAKHQSAWETLAFQTVFPHYVWIVKREALWIPVFGWGLAALQPIAINRQAGRSAVAQIIDQGRQRLKQGLGIMIFPEGTRVQPLGRHRYGLSAALLAIETGAPLVPIAHNAGCFWPPRRMGGFRPGIIDVVIGRPVEPAGHDAESLTAAVRDWMDQTGDQLVDNARIADNFAKNAPFSRDLPGNHAG